MGRFYFVDFQRGMTWSTDVATDRLDIYHSAKVKTLPPLQQTTSELW